MACGACGISFPELTPQSFSFNSPQGMCVDCNGFGSRVEIDPDLVIPDGSLSIDQGAIKPWGPNVTERTGWAHGFRRSDRGTAGDRPGQAVAQAVQPPPRPAAATARATAPFSSNGRASRGRGQFDMAWEGVLPRLDASLQASGVRTRKALVLPVPRRHALFPLQGHPGPTGECRRPARRTLRSSSYRLSPSMRRAPSSTTSTSRARRSRSPRKC